MAIGPLAAMITASTPPKCSGTASVAVPLKLVRMVPLVMVSAPMPLIDGCAGPLGRREFTVSGASSDCAPDTSAFPPVAAASPSPCAKSVARVERTQPLHIVDRQEGTLREVQRGEHPRNNARSRSAVRAATDRARRRVDMNLRRFGIAEVSEIFCLDLQDPAFGPDHLRNPQINCGNGRGDEIEEPARSFRQEAQKSFPRVPTAVPADGAIKVSGPAR